LQGRERFCYLHVNFLPAQICLLRGRKSTDPLRMQPENSIYSSHNAKTGECL
jgi:hypothetical protein